MMQEDEMRKAWCGNCGFKDSETCCSETNWKRCRLMSSEPEGKNVEARLELARQSAREKVLDKFLKKMRAEMTSPFEYLDWDSIEAVYIRLRQEGR